MLADIDLVSSSSSDESSDDEDSEDPLVEMYVSLRTRLQNVFTKENLPYFDEKRCIQMACDILFEPVIHDSPILPRRKIDRAKRTDDIYREIMLYNRICRQTQSLPKFTSVYVNAFHRTFLTNGVFAKEVRALLHRKKSCELRLTTARKKHQTFTDDLHACTLVDPIPSIAAMNTLSDHVVACDEFATKFLKYRALCVKLKNTHELIDTLETTLIHLEKMCQWTNIVLDRNEEERARERVEHQELRMTTASVPIWSRLPPDLLGHVRDFIGEPFLTDVRQYAIVYKYTPTIRSAEHHLCKWSLSQLRAFAKHAMFYACLHHLQKHNELPVSRIEWVRVLADCIYERQMHRNYEFVRLLFAVIPKPEAEIERV